jgi:hypothetical protein
MDMMGSAAGPRRLRACSVIMHFGADMSHSLRARGEAGPPARADIQTALDSGFFLQRGMSLRGATPPLKARGAKVLLLPRAVSRLLVGLSESRLKTVHLFQQGLPRRLHDEAMALPVFARLHEHHSLRYFENYQSLERYSDSSLGCS